MNVKYIAVVLLGIPLSMVGCAQAPKDYTSSPEFQREQARQAQEELDRNIKKQE